MSDLHLFKIDEDGYGDHVHFIVAHDADEALRIGREDYAVDEWGDGRPEVSKVHDDELLTIGFPDDDPELMGLPKGTVIDRPEDGCPKVTLTARQWCEGCQVGAYVGGTIDA